MKKEKLIAKKEEICRRNRTGEYFDNTDPEFADDLADSGLRLYVKKLELSYCRHCSSSVTHKGQKYCLLDESEYSDVE